MFPLLALATNICRSRFESTVSTPGSNDPIGTLWVIPAWLHDQIASQVDRFTVVHWTDVYRCDLDAVVSMDGCVDSMETFQRASA